MAGIEGGVSGLLQEVGLGVSIPAHVASKPVPHGNNGHYRIARTLTPAATTLAGILWTLRNPSASGLVMVLHKLTLRVVQVAAPSAAIQDTFNAKIARAYTVADATGSASIAPGANMQEVRSSMATASMQVREANVAAGASAGTKTLDTDGFVTGSVWIAAALASGLGNGPVTVLDYFPDVSSGEHPITLAADEGIVISNGNNFGAASGIVLMLDLAWAETTLY